jgi:HK97 family phage prohead protease
MENEQGEYKRFLVVCDEWIYKGDDGAEKGDLTGYGSIYGNVDADGDVMDPGCFEDDMKAHKETGAVPHMFYNHSMMNVCGNWLKLEDKAKGLVHSGKIAVGRGIPVAEQAHIVASSKTMKGLSVGFQIKPKGAEYGDGKPGSPNRTIKRAGLVETSIVPFPKNAKAIITGVKGAIGEKDFLSIREAEEILRDVAMFSGTEAKSFLALLKKGWDQQRDAEITTKLDLDRLQNGILNLIAGLKKPQQTT